MSENKDKKSFLKIINEINDGITEIFNQIPISIKKKLYSSEMRFTLAILILFINVHSYNYTKQRYSKSNCFDLFGIKISCSKFYYYFILLLLLLEILFLVFLQKTTSIAALPNYWWIVLVLLAFLLIASMEDDAELTQKDGGFNPPPMNMMRYFSRCFFAILVILLSVLSFGIEVVKKNNQTKNLLIIRGVSIILLIINAYNTFTFSSCKYNLPDSWKL